MTELCNFSGIGMATYALLSRASKYEKTGTEVSQDKLWGGCISLSVVSCIMNSGFDMATSASATIRASIYEKTGTECFAQRHYDD